MQLIEKYGMYEITMPGRGITLPECTFTNGGTSVTVQGFCENADHAAVRFMPTETGLWKCTMRWEGQTRQDQFECVPNTGNNHGPVRPDGMHFRYDDGTRYIPFGTTCYAWIHQLPEVISQTLDTLKSSPFNKLRMCVFPKSMPYNQNDPEFYPFERREDGTWDVSRPDQRYWNHLDNMLTKLQELNIEADLILFHPYDRWGFSTMPQQDNLTYLNYAIRRLSAYRNLWWSLSNEYEFSFSKTIADWDQFGEMIAAQDPYRHMLGAHNWITPYPKRDWMTHVSYQGKDAAAIFDIREEYKIPVIDDECGYEGDIEFHWGNLSCREFMDRVWTITAFGCYAMHGETFHREDEVLWWAKGGRLYGQAPARIRFLREVLESLPGPMEPACTEAVRDPNGNASSEGQKKLIQKIWEMNSEQAKDHIRREMMRPIGRHPDFRLIYLGRGAQSICTVELPESGSYRAEIIDTMAMERREAVSGVHGTIRLGLPGKEGIAILITRLSGEPL